MNLILSFCTPPPRRTWICTLEGLGLDSNFDKKVFTNIKKNKTFCRILFCKFMKAFSDSSLSYQNVLATPLICASVCKIFYPYKLRVTLKLLDFCDLLRKSLRVTNFHGYKIYGKLMTA